MKQQLYVFQKVVELKSFSKAAEELFMSQPAVSQYVQSLEQSFGTKLLERTNKVISLTKAGEIVYAKGKEILNLYNNMFTLVDDLTNQANGSVTIGASYTFGEYMLPAIITELKKMYPQIEPIVHIGNSKDVIESVKQNSYDIGIIEGSQISQGDLHIEKFEKDTLYIVAAPHVQQELEEQGLTPSLLEKQTWIVREKGSGTREAAEALFQQLHIHPHDKMVFGSTQIIKESVESGIGIAFLSQSCFKKELELGTLAKITGEEYRLDRAFSLVIKETFQTKAVEVIIGMLKEHGLKQEG
ncbi:LysR family transcriptional regulator [Bacillus testis]|uniref:LysR family transcriptional regulator n=1 Tax=Bacillus testis TaxID=1622072 RepID=UPI00067E7D19|nr:LysR family transcriptional regulator [Bacillus testis]